MRIISKPSFIVATFPATGVWHKWDKGSHTVNVWQGGTEIDCYTFAWEKDKPSMLDFTTSLLNWLATD